MVVVSSLVMSDAESDTGVHEGESLSAIRCDRGEIRTVKPNTTTTQTNHKQQETTLAHPYLENYLPTTPHPHQTNGYTDIRCENCFADRRRFPTNANRRFV